MKKQRWKSKNTGISVDIDLSLDDIYRDMSEYHCEEMVEWLMEDGYLDEFLEKGKNLTSTNAWDWEEVCNKLANNQLRLTNEEEEIIKKISNRL